MKKFKAESQKLLDLMINSVYTNKDIFLRELISNASDALDKRYYRSMTEDEVTLDGEELAIRLTVDTEARTLTLSDNGCGMNAEELEQNLGTIARSGSLDFKQQNQGQDIDIIGQFGVGFYSAFMVAEKVTVVSRPIGAEQAWRWESSGASGYTISDGEREGVGTDVILSLRPDTENEKLSDYLQEWRLTELIKRYSDYVRYPIQMLLHKSRPLPRPEDAPDDYQPEYEAYTEEATINSMVPLWKKGQNEISEEEYNEFYKTRFHDYSEPLRTIFSRAEGRVSYTALLFVPDHAPWGYYGKDYEKGLALYASGVLIMEKCGDLLPDYFSFIHGVVDSEDVSLNLSREVLQQDHQMKVIAASLEKKIKSELLTFLTNEREKYERFYHEFGRQLKFGIYADYGTHQELLQDLLLFWSAKEQKLVTLDEYVEKMGESQQFIYYAAGDEVERLSKLPACQMVLDKGCDVLLCPEDVDEFTFQTMRFFKEKGFKNVNSGDLGLESEEEKQAAATADEENKSLFQAMQEALGGRVVKVAAGTMLKNVPASLSASGPVSLEMEKVLSKLPGNDQLKSEQVLEVNPSHPVFATLRQAQDEGDTDKVQSYTQLLYDQARLLEGLSIDDPAAFAEKICQLMK